MIINCCECNKKVYRRPSSLLKNKRNFCSRDCWRKADHTGIYTQERNKKISEKLKGGKLSEKAKINIALGQRNRNPATRNISGIVGSNLGKTNEKSHHWVGDKVKYNALHDWVRRVLGKPDTCKKCCKSNLSGKKIHWANISHKYKRDIKDWIRLCVSCHKLYDKGKLIL